MFSVTGFQDELTAAMKWSPDMRPYHPLGYEDYATCQWTFSIITSFYSRAHSAIMNKDDDTSASSSPETWTDHSPGPQSRSSSVTARSSVETTMSTLPASMSNFGTERSPVEPTSATLPHLRDQSWYKKSSSNYRAT